MTPPVTLSVDITHRIGAFTLEAAFDAPPGVTVLFGPSGSGKTTLANAVAGLVRPDRGRIGLGGEVLFDTAQGRAVPVHRRGIGYVFQDARLFPHLTVRGNLAYGARYARGRPVPDLDAVAGMLGISALLDRRPAGLSGGEAQRVAIGRALLAAPRLLIADEPLAALDEPRRAEILPCFEALRDRLDIPMLYVSHAVDEVARLATTVIALSDGRVIRRGPAAEVLADPAVTPSGAGATVAVIEPRIAAQPADGLTELALGPHRITVPRIDRPEGTALRAYVAARDVMLSVDRPTGISALNVLPATVVSVDPLPDGASALVTLDLGPARLLSHVTQRSVAALALAPGREIHAVIKAMTAARR